MVGGGLNFQIEHHLFPKISHVHYPAVSKISPADLCRSRDKIYRISPGAPGHRLPCHLLKHLGRPPENLEIWIL